MNGNRKVGSSRPARVRRISIVTPCFNAAAYIEETMRSVLANHRSGSDFELQYIVVDGGSGDGTQSIAERVFDGERRLGLHTKLVCEPDKGMYDALAKGFRLADGDACAYLNAGDLYSPQAMDVATNLLSRPGITWITGLQVRYNELSQLVSAKLPFRYRERLLSCGAYDGRVLPCVQQESTFWRRELLDGVDLGVLACCRLAGDFYLWHRFSRAHALYVVQAWLGGFKVHRGQLSANMDAYRAELHSICRRAGAGDRILAQLDRVIWHSPPWVKRRLNRDSLFTYDFAREDYVLGAA